MNVVGRFLFALIFMASGFYKLHAHYNKIDGPLVVQMGGKLDAFFGSVADLTKVTIPVSQLQDKYPQVLLLAGVMECMGGFLMVMNHVFGGVLLVSVR